MIIDIAISSCARPDMMEVAMNSFMDNIVTSHKLRFVLLEDMVEDAARQEEGRKWLRKNKSMFDKIYYAKKQLTNVYALTELMQYIKSPVFFRQEDDVIYLKKIELDPLIELMLRHDEIAQIQWKRSVANARDVYEGKDVVIDGIPLTSFRMYSSTTGLYNRDWTLRIMAKAKNKWSPCQKKSNPAMMKLRGDNHSLAYYFGAMEEMPHAMHLGKQMGYGKGKWKK